MNRILIPLDGSEFSAQILGAVKKFFTADACELVLIHVGAPTEGHVGLPPRPAAAEVSVPMYETDKDVELMRHPIYETQEADSRLAALRDQFEAVVQELRSAGYRVTVEAHLGNAAEAIIERTRGGDIDLVAMTTHGRSRITRLLFGSVAEQVVRNTSLPVLILRPAQSNNAELAPEI